MNESSQPPQAAGASTEVTSTAVETEVENQPQQSPSQRPPSYVKLAMRNMVRKRAKSLYHFALTTFGLLAVLVGLAYLTH